MVQPEALAHYDVEVRIANVIHALDVLSLVFDTNAEDRTFNDGQCAGMRLLFDALKDKLNDAADAASVMEVNLRHAEKQAEPQNAIYQSVWEFGTEYGAICARNGEDHRGPPPPAFRTRFRGWTGEPPVADQPVYPQVHPATPQAEEPDARCA